MPKTSVSDWSTTAASNTDVGGININEGNAPSTMNNAVREAMAQVKTALGMTEKYATFTGAHTILATEHGTFFRKTNGAATWAPQAAATCGDGWHVTIRVEDADLTIDPQGTETIDGATTLIVPANTTVQLWCNGTAFYSDRSGAWISWTPGVSFGAATTGITYGTQTGLYKREGKTVTAAGLITLTSKGSATGVARITGLPFDASNTLNFILSVGYHENMASITGGGISGLLVSTTAALLYQPGSTSTAVLTDANFTNTSNIRFQVTYEAA